MSQPQAPAPYRTLPVQVAVVLVTGVLAGMATVPDPDPAEVDRLKAEYSFSPELLFAPATPEGMVHGVNKNAWQLHRYLYMVGATAALGDLDGDGLPNDVCYNHISAKALVLSPAPGTGERYAPFVVDFGERVDLRRMAPTVCNLLDANEDGLTDIFVGFGDRGPLLMLRKDLGQAGGAPLTQDAFVFQELVEGGREALWSTLTATVADVDGDGHDDLVIGNYFADGARVHDPDSDEPFEMNDGFNWAENGGTNRIMLWQSAAGGESPSARYVDAGAVFPDLGATRWTLAVAAGDIDLDGLSDLYISNDHGPDQLLMNRSTPGKVELVELRGEKGFFTPRSFQMGHDTFKGMGADFADINDDGVFDLYVSNIGSAFALGEAHFLWVSDDAEARLARGVSPYDNRGTELGVSYTAWAWESLFDDFNNDGVDELVQATGFMQGDHNAWNDLGNFGLMNDRLVADPHNWPLLPEGHDIDGWDPNPFFARGETGAYVDLSVELFPGITPNTRSIATGDVDGDGDLDMVYGNIWQDSMFLRNDAPSPGEHLSIHLLHALDAQAWGVQSHGGHPALREGSPAVGALVKVQHPDGRVRMRQVDGGNGHAGQRSTDLHFGLGELPADAALPVTISWRDREGVVHEDQLTLSPGWHTVTLSPRTEAPPPPPVEDAELPAAEATELPTEVN